MVKRTTVLSGGMTLPVLDTPVLLLVRLTITSQWRELLDSTMVIPHLVLVLMQLYSEILPLVVLYSVLVELQKELHSMTTKILHSSRSLLHLSSLEILIGSVGMHRLLKVDYSVLVVQLRKQHLIIVKIL